MKAIKTILASAVAAAAVFALPAHATLVTYTSASAFQAAAGATTLETFSNATLGTSTANFSGTFLGFTLTSVANGDKSGIATTTISGGDNSPIPGAFANQKFYGWGDSGDGNIAPTSTFTFAPGTRAFGFDWFNTDFSDSYSVTINNQIVLTLPVSQSGFYGVVATGGETFTSARIATQGYGGFISTVGLDNVRVSAVPEPTGVALLGAGLLGFVASRRKRVK